MIAMILFGIAILGACFYGVYWYNRHHSICDAKIDGITCGANVWLKFTNATPSGPNPLGIRAEVETMHCKTCGIYQQRCAGVPYR
jgi:hypothetical protein